MRKNKRKNAIEKQKKRMGFTLPEEIKRYIWGALFFLMAAILVLSFFEKAGVAGRIIFSFLNYLIGKSIYLLPFILVISGLVFFLTHYEKFLGGILLATWLLIGGSSGILENFETGEKLGGYLGYLAGPLFQLFGFWVSQIIFVLLILVGLLIFWQLLRPTKTKEKPSLPTQPTAGYPAPAKVGLIKRIFAPKFKIREIEPKIKEIPVKSEAPAAKLETKEKPLISAYQMPPRELLDSDKGQPSAGDIRQNSIIIKKTLENFGIPSQMSEVNIGPTVTQYTLKPADGIKLSKITSLTNDLALALASHPIRIEAPVPGKSLVGIEVPNKIRTLVRLRDLISNPQFQNSPSNLTISLGRDVSGNPVYADLAKMPHLLVAGSTGTGKTSAADTLMFTERGMLTFEELCPLPLNSETDFRLKLVTRDGVETTEKNYNNGICQFYKLSTNRGFQIEATAEHPLWVMKEDGTQTWKPASLIKKGDYVAISREPALFGNKIDFSDFQPSKIKAYHKKISFPSIMTSQLAQFLGFLSADGGLSTERKGIHRVVYTQANPYLIQLYKKSLKALFGITQFIEKRSGSNPKNKAKDIEVNSKHLKEFLAYLGMDSSKSPKKEIPRAIREAPKEIVSAYLKALFDNDGCVGEKTPIELSLSSKKLISQVHLMLLNFGIISSLKIKKVKEYPQNKYFRLSIYGEEARKFIQAIGFIRKEKYNKVKEFLKLSPNPNVDLIPHISLLLKRLGQKYLNRFARLTNRGWRYQSGILIPKYAFSSLRSYNSGYRNPGYQSLKKILEFYQPISQEFEYRQLIEVSKRNFYWDKIEKIERTSGVGYDFYVPGSDSFVGNGFVNHNTIFLNSLILSLIFRNSPEILRFILIDPKRVEFPVYNDLPHLLTSVIFDAQKTVNTLKWLIGEMERRFEILAESKTRDIASYNEIVARTQNSKTELPKEAKVKKRTESSLTLKTQNFEENFSEVMPYIVLIIDELADLMAARGREVEVGIVRLAQMARAVGIHLVVATQRPSVEVITGLIKANITSRITFQVASQVDSRTVLDMAGAEKLLGRGDMLFVSAEVSKPRRIQSSYISEKEVRRVVNWIKSKIPPKESLGELMGQEISLEKPETEFEGFYGEDSLYEEAKRIVIEAKKASASLLQRKLRIGYARAARLLDMLEERGVVGPGQGAKPREIYFQDEKNEDEEGWRKV